MSDFNYLTKMEVKADDTAEFEIFAIDLPNGKCPTLIGRHGGESNRAYANAIVKDAVQQQRMVRAGKMSVAMIAANRDQDRELYAKHVITGWRDVCDSEGNEVKYSQEACLGFLKALPGDIFDMVREFFGNPANFRHGVDPEDAVAKGKNSPSG